MKKCPLCEFTIDTGDFIQDDYEMTDHWFTHSDKEKAEYFTIEYFAMLPKDERSFRPVYGWENRIDRITMDLLRLGETVEIMKEKMSAEERLVFKQKLDELFKYWERFKRIHDAYHSSAYYQRGP